MARKVSRRELIRRAELLLYYLKQEELGEEMQRKGPDGQWHTVQARYTNFREPSDRFRIKPKQPTRPMTFKEVMERLQRDPWVTMKRSKVAFKVTQVDFVHEQFILNESSPPLRCTTDNFCTIARIWRPDARWNELDRFEVPLEVNDVEEPLDDDEDYDDACLDLDEYPYI